MENKQCSVFIETAWQFSIIHYQFSKFHNLFLTQRQFLHSFCCYNPRVFDTDGTNAWQTIFGSKAKTMPGSSSCFMRGASTGISLISSPMP